MSLLRTSLATLAGAAALIGIGVSSAAAMPLGPLSAGPDTDIQNVRLVCRHGRCWNTYARSYGYAPNYYANSYYGGPTYYRAPYYGYGYGLGMGIGFGRGWGRRW